VLKILTGPEGAADYCQMLMSFENAPSIIVIDFAPMDSRFGTDNMDSQFGTGKYCT